MDDGTELIEEEPGSHTYGEWGTYTIRLIGANSYCSDTAYRTVVINPPVPVANFTGPAQGCVPLTVQFENLSQYAAISNWQFGDGGQANATNPVYTYYTPGTYTVTLTVTGFNGSTDVMTLEQIIVVYPNAQAAFTVTPNEISIPSQPVYYLNLSENATTYTWDFGDDTYSNEVSPIHYYTAEGLYTITLIANNQYNCPDTMLLYDAVYAKKGGLIDFPNAFSPDPTGTNGGAYNPNSYDNDVFFPIHSGVTEYQLLIFNKWGELLYESKDVNKGWDGYYRGQLCKQDVYVWKVRARFVDGQRFEQAGDVTLIVK
jgi:gliding motility-associated-like protein